jgi:serine/threonine-protein kinase RsbT
MCLPFSIDAFSTGQILAKDTFAITQAKDVINIRKYGRDLAQQYQFSKLDQTRFATALSEIARNVINYAIKGSCLFTVSECANKLYLIAVIEDQGPGIADIENAMTDGYSSCNGLGLGLPGAKRLVHYFQVESNADSTKVTLVIVKQLALS